MQQAFFKQDLAKIEEILKKDGNEANVIVNRYSWLDNAIRFNYLDVAKLMFKYGGKPFHQNPLYSAIWSNNFAMIEFVENNLTNDYGLLNHELLSNYAMSNAMTYTNELARYNTALYLIKEKKIDSKYFIIHSIQRCEPLSEYLTINELMNLDHDVGYVGHPMPLNLYLNISTNFVHPYLKYILQKSKSNSLFVYAYNNDLIKLELMLNSRFCDINYEFSPYIGTIYEYCLKNNKMEALYLIKKYN